MYLDVVVVVVVGIDFVSHKYEQVHIHIIKRKSTLNYNIIISVESNYIEYMVSGFLIELWIERKKLCRSEIMNIV